MGKAIALKLTEKEERIVNQLNQQGVTHSELLRDALWNYFNSSVRPVNQAPPEKVNLDKPEQPVSRVTHDYIKHLEEEIRHLRDQNRKLQEQLGGEITRLHGQIYRFSSMKINSDTSRQTSSKQERPISDIHSDIDNFLKKDPKKV